MASEIELFLPSLLTHLPKTGIAVIWHRCSRCNIQSIAQLLFQHAIGHGILLKRALLGLDAHIHQQLVAFILYGS